MYVSPVVFLNLSNITLLSINFWSIYVKDLSLCKMKGKYQCCFNHLKRSQREKLWHTQLNPFNRCDCWETELVLKLFSQFFSTPSYLYRPAPTLLPLVLPAHEWGKKKTKTNPTPSEGYKEFHYLPAALTYSNSHCQHSNSILMFPCCKAQLLSLRWPVCFQVLTQLREIVIAAKFKEVGGKDEKCIRATGDRLMAIVSLLLLPYPHEQCDKKWELIFSMFRSNFWAGPFSNSSPNCVVQAPRMSAVLGSPSQLLVQPSVGISATQKDFPVHSSNSEENIKSGRPTSRHCFIWRHDDGEFG